jgi:hypothetical protein
VYAAKNDHGGYVSVVSTEAELTAACIFFIKAAGLEKDEWYDAWAIFYPTNMLCIRFAYVHIYTSARFDPPSSTVPRDAPS